ncbi:MAG TPA: aspartate kinase, partial [Thermoguttaceae bacterium]|nr:aspartate kinase [Thermoguttaceae bacterium]
SIIVQKFGGTSVADSEKILAAARKAIRAQREGNQVVMVVSAMGKNTDTLVSLAAELTDEPPAREMDMLLSTGEQVSVALMAMAIHSLGHEAISLTGAQIGIVTDSTHTKARIRSISTDRMRAALDAGKIVIAAGFQGVDDAFNITTLGRGGSDTTAVALAAVLGADSCEIYTDVDGVYTTDPRVVPEARRTGRISYDEMLELASAGAGVMHNRAIEFAKKFSVPIHVRSSFSDVPGTMITSEPESTLVPVCGAAKARDEARVTVLGVPNRPGAALTIFSEIAAKKVAMDMIVQNVAADGHTDISFTVFRDDLPATLKAVEESTRKLEVEGYNYDEDLAKVSVVGAGMATQTGVAEKMFRALAEKQINILMITTSEIKISVLVTKEQAQEALRTVHEVFQLDQEPAVANPDAPLAAHRPSAVDATDLAAKIEQMEELIIEGISLDESQAMVTMIGLADSPGLAAKLFEAVAADGILVDMIVQSMGREGHANITFTVPQKDLVETLRITGDLAGELECPPPASLPTVAKLSVCGIGMRSHTSVAQRMFESLAAAGINVEVISTSEVHVNIVVEGQQGKEAFATLQKEFADVIV